MQQQLQTLMAMPMDCPGKGSELGIPRLAYSLPSDFAIPITTKKIPNQIEERNERKPDQSRLHRPGGWGASNQSVLKREQVEDCRNEKDAG